jgi:hypothetical protein
MFLKDRNVHAQLPTSVTPAMVVFCGDDAAGSGWPRAGGSGSCTYSTVATVRSPAAEVGRHCMWPLHPYAVAHAAGGDRKGKGQMQPMLSASTGTEGRERR